MKAHSSSLPAAFLLALSAATAANTPVPRVAVLPAGPALAVASGPRLQPTGLRFNVCCYTASMVAADLDTDGHPDLFAGNGLSNDVSILLADGAGGFGEPVNLPLDNVEIGYIVVAAGDVTGDGHADLVATGYTESQIALYPGDGSGTFGSRQSLSTGAGRYPMAVVLADVDGDGATDIATANSSGDVSILRADGAGGFAAAVTFPTGAHPVSVAIADLDGDGTADVATAHAVTGTIAVLRGDGAGGFAGPVSVPVGPYAQPNALAVADLDGDGDSDVVVANTSLDDSPFPPPELPGSVSVLLNDGAGGFAEAVVHPLGPGDGRAQAVALGDVTGDGHVDVVASRPLANTADLLAGDGVGGFAGAVALPAGLSPMPVLILDATGDGHPDVLTGNASGSSVSVLPGDGAGTVGFPGNFRTGAYPHAVVTTDFNGDGLPDAATANALGDDVSVLLNDGQGGFAPELRHAVGRFPTGIVAGDLDGDGHADLATANLSGGTVSILLGDGQGGFADARHFEIQAGVHSPYALALGDADGDGHLDIATANTNWTTESVSVLRGDGSGAFGPATILPVGPEGVFEPHGIVLADVTGDGDADIVTANTRSDTLSLFAGSGDGTFAPAVLLPADGGPVAVAAGDVDGDGRVDLVSLNTTTQNVSVLTGDDAAGFRPAMHYPVARLSEITDYNPWPWGLALGDVDGDGRLDIVTANTQNDTVSVLPNDGAGGFDAFFTFGTGSHPGAAAVADIDGDGQADVLTANRANGTLSVLFNRTHAADTLFADGFE